MNSVLRDIVGNQYHFGMYYIVTLLCSEKQRFEFCSDTTYFSPVPPPL